ncbi:TlpA disulfide reductase family protein [Daejeonella sp. H1SJ63]|uniref:peroxiredoxin family protein n=1 Tax=Daejeonella sp. H1SJ63 TaxID=3034145 RepID=UPI0023EDFE54|nr:TlpA disulfide reductase family protein [Daejeonella sp. H1SJ63]
MINRIINNLKLAVVLILFYSCQSSDNQGLKQGLWRATLKTQSGAEIPFNFEVKDSADQKFLEIINGEERFRVNEISLKGDSILIRMPLFESEIKTILKNGSIRGQWVKYFGDSIQTMQFNASFNDKRRFFKAGKEPKSEVSGRWSVNFQSADGTKSYPAIGEFRQQDGRVLGTFLTSTGDYRYLEGTVSGNNLYLSCFDGSHAYLFTGKLLNGGAISDGKFYSGLNAFETWTAKKDENAMLPDAYSMTALKSAYDKIDFSFPALDGKKVSLSDEKFKNKVVLVQLFGSWCPNCMDETVFLTSFYKKYNAKGVEIIALAYERSTDPVRAVKNVTRLRDRFNVPYDMLVTGYSNDKAEVAKSLPMLKNFVAFPTLMIIDRQGKVRKIHTGFSGPGTGSHYTDFVGEFEKTIDNLLAEK